MKDPLTTQDWEEIHRTKVWGTWPPEAFVGFMSTYKEPASFIEIGCGAGAQLRYFAESGHKVTAFDASASAIARAQVFAYRAKGHITLKVCDVREFVPEEKVDCVIDVCTLQHLSLTTVSGMLGKIKRQWLKPGGVMFSVMLNEVQGVDVLDARRSSAATLGTLFAGWGLDISRAMVTFNDGSFISHWIIRAKINGTA